MSVTLGHQEIIRRIIRMAPHGVSIALPNGPGKTLPRYVVRDAGGSQTTTTLSGTVEAAAEVLVLVDTATGLFATQSNELTAALVQMFPPALRFGDETQMTVVDSPSVRPPLPSLDGVYSVPVMIRARLTF